VTWRDLGVLLGADIHSDSVSDGELRCGAFPTLHYTSCKVTCSTVE
jgi:hypothetical protein